MAKVDPVEQMKATAVGGPVAGNEYAAQQGAVQNLRQQTLNDAGNRAGMIQAPDTFKAAQDKILSTPLNAAANELGAKASASNAYTGAMNNAQAGYLSALPQVQGLVQQQLQKQAQSDYQSALGSVATQQKKETTDQTAADKAKRDATVNELAGRRDVDIDTYDTIKDVLGKADNYDAALRELESVERKSLDDNGNFVDANGNPSPYDPSAARAWLQQAYLNPQQIQAIGASGQPNSTLGDVSGANQ
jgi:hypothetical protein